MRFAMIIGSPIQKVADPASTHKLCAIVPMGSISIIQAIFTVKNAIKKKKMAY